MIRNGWRQKDTFSGYFVLSTALITIISGLFNTQLLDAGMAFLLSVTAGLQEAFPEKTN